MKRLRMHAHPGDRAASAAASLTWTMAAFFRRFSSSSSGVFRNRPMSVSGSQHACCRGMPGHQSRRGSSLNAP